MRKAMALVFSAVVVMPLAAKAQQGLVIGAATISCPTIAQNSRQNPVLALAYSSWAIGFMSGINITKHTVKEPTRDLSAIPLNELQGRLQDYCDHKPNADFGDAVLDLYNSLPEVAP
jgi:hypothetical protein